MQARKSKLVCLASCLLSSSLATAGDMGAVAKAPAAGELSFSAGYFNAETGRQQHIDIVDLVGNNYWVHKKNDGNFLIGLGYMANNWDFSRFNLGLGVKAFYLGKTKVTGVIEQENIYTNLAYKYDITHIPIYAMARASLSPFSPNYTFNLDGGLGVNVLTTNAYDERSLDNGVTIPDFSFSGHTRTRFSATAGVGIKFNNLLNTAGIELGYRFYYLGQGNFEPKTGFILNRLQTKDIYANAVVLTISI